jgi:thiol-disulfide isomerase/thioredoxin
MKNYSQNSKSHPIFVLILGLILLMAGCVASTGETPDVSQAVSTTNPADSICLTSAETPCGPDESSADQQTALTPVPTSGSVRAVLFWMEGCPFCETVLNNVLPPLEAKYGNTLEVHRVEVEGIQAVDQLYQLGERLGIPKDDIGVPFLLLGDRALIGYDAIQKQLPLLIEAELARGGVDFPAVPEFNILPTGTAAQPTDQPVPTANQVAIYFFWGDGCPHCAVAKPFLQSLDQNSEQVELHAFEVYYVAENQALFLEMAKAFGFVPQSVPTIFIGEQYWEGYSDQIKNEIQAAVDACLMNGCPDAGLGIIPGVGALEVVP